MVYRNSTTVINKPRYQIYVAESLFQAAIKYKKPNDYRQRPNDAAADVHLQLLIASQLLFYLNHASNSVALHHAQCVAHDPVAVTILHPREKDRIGFNGNKDTVALEDAVTLHSSDIDTIHSHTLDGNILCRGATNGEHRNARQSVKIF